MTRSILAAIAGLFAAFALAQSTVPSAAPTNKDKQEMVKDATAGAGKGYGQAAAEGSAKPRNPRTRRRRCSTKRPSETR